MNWNGLLLLLFVAAGVGFGILQALVVFLFGLPWLWILVERESVTTHGGYRLTWAVTSFDPSPGPTNQNNKVGRQPK